VSPWGKFFLTRLQLAPDGEWRWGSMEMYRRAWEPIKVLAWFNLIREMSR
jgi:hypothetical protein